MVLIHKITITALILFILFIAISFIWLAWDINILFFEDSSLRLTACSPVGGCRLSTLKPLFIIDYR